MLIGVFCSGGDSPGMNACIRAVVRRAVFEGHQVVGIRRGYQGLLEEDFFRNEDGLPRMTDRDVWGIIRFGGTMLRSSRSPEFQTEAGQKKAADILHRHKIEALVAIGGDGTFRGAAELAGHWDGQVVGCPGTIDNDLIGTDFTLGFSTAVHTAVEAADKIRDTAESHERMFLIEVMGRSSGFIAVYTALACAAEGACIPETETDIAQLVRDLQELKRRGKTSIRVIVAEGDEGGGAEKLNQTLIDAGCPYQSRVVVLGYLQRGGSPTPEDRILASQLGEWAVETLVDGKTGLMVGNVGGEKTLTPFSDTFTQSKQVPGHLLELVGRLSR